MEVSTLFRAVCRTIGQELPPEPAAPVAPPAPYDYSRVTLPILTSAELRALPIVCECEVWRDLIYHNRNANDNVRALVSVAWCNCEARRRAFRPYDAKREFGKLLKRDRKNKSKKFKMLQSEPTDKALASGASLNGSTVVKTAPSEAELLRHAIEMLKALEPLWSEAEQRIADLFVGGITQGQDIAAHLGVSHGTVSYHLSNMKRKAISIVD